VNKSRAT